MKKILSTLIIVLLWFNTFAQDKSKTVMRTYRFEISAEVVKCNESNYTSLLVENLTNDTIVIEFDAELYWSSAPSIPTTDDEVYTIILNPLETVSGDCLSKRLMLWSSGPQTKIRLVSFKLINVIFGKL